MGIVAGVRRLHKPSKEGHYNNVLAIEDESDGVSVYAPPYEGADGWVQTYPSAQEASVIANSVASSRGQSIVTTTHDGSEWWRRGLIPA